VNDPADPGSEQQLVIAHVRRVSQDFDVMNDRFVTANRGPRSCTFAVPAYMHQQARLNDERGVVYDTAVR
jgi:hypothetical protein